jgi:hypothetical protein
LLSQSRRFEEQFQAQDRQIEQLSFRFSTIGHEFDQQRSNALDVNALKTEMTALQDAKLTTAVQTLRGELTAAVRELKDSQMDLTFCPKHQTTVYRIPSPPVSIACPFGCDQRFCATCRKWHDIELVCNPDPPGVKRCPFCALPVVKTSGANNITCRCGKHWCWVCRAGFDTGREVYAHLTQVHGGFYSIS